MTTGLEVIDSIAKPAELERERAKIAEFNPMVEQARALTIDTDAHATIATDLLARAAGMSREAETRRKAITKPMADAKKATDTMFKEIQAPLALVREIVAPKLLAFNEEKRKAAEAEERERQRLIREEQAKAEKARREREDEARQMREAAAREAAAAEAAANRDNDPEAEQRAAEARAAEQRARVAERVAAETQVTVHDTTPVERPQNTVRATSGSVSGRTTWEFTIEDETRIPREFLVVDEKKIRAAVQKDKGDAQIPGVRVYQKHDLAVKAKPAVRS